MIAVLSTIFVVLAIGTSHCSGQQQYIQRDNVYRSGPDPGYRGGVNPYQQGAVWVNANGNGPDMGGRQYMGAGPQDVPNPRYYPPAGAAQRPVNPDYYVPSYQQQQQQQQLYPPSAGPNGGNWDYQGIQDRDSGYAVGYNQPSSMQQQQRGDYVPYQNAYNPNNRQSYPPQSGGGGAWSNGQIDGQGYRRPAAPMMPSGNGGSYINRGGTTTPVDMSILNGIPWLQQGSDSQNGNSRQTVIVLATTDELILPATATTKRRRLRPTTPSRTTVAGQTTIGAATTVAKSQRPRRTKATAATTAFTTTALPVTTMIDKQENLTMTTKRRRPRPTTPASEIVTTGKDSVFSTTSEDRRNWMQMGSKKCHCSCDAANVENEQVDSATFWEEASFPENETTTINSSTTNETTVLVNNGTGSDSITSNSPSTTPNATEQTASSTIESEASPKATADSTDTPPTASSTSSTLPPPSLPISARKNNNLRFYGRCQCWCVD